MIRLRNWGTIDPRKQWRKITYDYQSYVPEDVARRSSGGVIQLSIVDNRVSAVVLHTSSRQSGNS